MCNSSSTVSDQRPGTNESMEENLRGYGGDENYDDGLSDSVFGR